MLALSLTVSVAFRTPAEAGVKNIETVQLEPAARLLGLKGQVVVVE
jgi:hypothetical protein